MPPVGAVQAARGVTIAWIVLATGCTFALTSPGSVEMARARQHRVGFSGIAAPAIEPRADSPDPRAAASTP